MSQEKRSSFFSWNRNRSSKTSVLQPSVSATNQGSTTPARQTTDSSDDKTIENLTPTKPSTLKQRGRHRRQRSLDPRMVASIKRSQAERRRQSLTPTAQSSIENAVRASHSVPTTPTSQPDTLSYPGVKIDAATPKAKQNKLATDAQSASVTPVTDTFTSSLPATPEAAPLPSKSQTREQLIREAQAFLQQAATLYKKAGDDETVKSLEQIWQQQTQKISSPLSNHTSLTSPPTPKSWYISGSPATGNDAKSAQTRHTPQEKVPQRQQRGHLRSRSMHFSFSDQDKARLSPGGVDRGRFNPKVRLLVGKINDGKLNEFKAFIGKNLTSENTVEVFEVAFEKFQSNSNESERLQIVLEFANEKSFPKLDTTVALQKIIAAMNESVHQDKQDQLIELFIAFYKNSDAVISGIPDNYRQKLSDKGVQLHTASIAEQLIKPTANDSKDTDEEVSAVVSDQTHSASRENSPATGEFFQAKTAPEELLENGIENRSASSASLTSSS